MERRNRQVECLGMTVGESCQMHPVATVHRDTFG
jgi:hypothetical protein